MAKADVTRDYAIGQMPTPARAHYRRMSDSDLMRRIRTLSASGSLAKIIKYEGGGVRKRFSIDASLLGIAPVLLEKGSFLRPIIEQTIDDLGDVLENNINIALTRGDLRENFLYERTGQLRQSIRISRRRIARKPHQFSRSFEVGSTGTAELLYARILEKGGVIRAKYEDYLHFPFSPRGMYPFVTDWVRTKQVSIPARRPFTWASEETQRTGTLMLQENIQSAITGMQ